MRKWGEDDLHPQREEANNRIPPRTSAGSMALRTPRFQTSCLQDRASVQFCGNLSQQLQETNTKGAICHIRKSFMWTLGVRPLYVSQLRVQENVP